MKKLIITLLCLAIVAGGSFGGYKEYQKRKDAKRIVDVVPVSLLKEEGWYDEEETTMSAEVTSGNVQRVKVANMSIIKEVKVDPGQEVKKGDVLIVYDTTVAELEVQQKKNRINVLKQELAKEEKALEKLKKLLPSELKPRERNYDPDDYDPDDYEPEDDSLPDEEPDDNNWRLPDSDSQPDDSVPDEPAPEPLAELTDPDIGGTLNDGVYEFACTPDTVVKQIFMSKASYLKRHIVLNVYDSNGVLRYCWDMDFAANDSLNNTDWRVGDGVTVTDDRVLYNGTNPSGAYFYVYTPVDDTDDPSGEDEEYDDSLPDEDGDGEEDIEYDDDYDYDYDDHDYDDYDDYDDDDDDDDSENYMYSRAELAIKIKEKEMDIKTKKLDIRAARLEYKNSKKKKDSGVEVATIDGIVMKVGDEKYIPETEEDFDDFEDGEYDEEMFEDVVYRQPIVDLFETVDYDDDIEADVDGADWVDDDDDGGYSDDDFDIDFDDEDEDSYMDEESESAYLVVQGNAGVSLDINVGELNLSKFKEGTEISGMSYDNGSMLTAVVTGVKDQPAYYYSENYNENPNSSTYVVTADVIDGDGLSVGSWVDLYM
ncbi:MAG: efflux RND transporter periplasmic adaptor subunit, partial [Ruminococcus sp.]|nr:efflux RND transporter periplasmic adaptor subunit [Ruminococcus sp.]